jgi:hypothetical protein
MKPYDAAKILQIMHSRGRYRPDPLRPIPRGHIHFDPSHITEVDDHNVKSLGHIGFFGDVEAFESENGAIYISKRSNLFARDGRRINREIAGHIRHYQRSIDHIRKTYGEE